MKIFVTGSTGFIGYHLCNNLLHQNHTVYSIDNMNNYYDVLLKKKRLQNLKKNRKFFFSKIDLDNITKINKIINDNKIQFIIHLAAQAGVEHSIKFPKKFMKSNIIGFFNILEISRKNKIKHLIFASSSSVYGNKDKFPLNEKFSTDHPLSFYAATKKSNELMAYSYANIYNLPCTALRFFTVYGPYGRPDMSLFKFTEAIINNKSISLFNNANHIRDFTYIEDVVISITKLINKIPKNKIPFNILNIGSNNPKQLKYFVNIIENILNKKSIKKMLPKRKGDVQKTHADISSLNKLIKYKPSTSIKKGIKEFVDWYKIFYRIK